MITIAIIFLWLFYIFEINVSLHFRHCCKYLFGCNDNPEPRDTQPIPVKLPNVKTLFDECNWKPFMSKSSPTENTWDIEMRETAFSNDFRGHVCGDDIDNAMYIDVRTREDDIPWDETDEYITKITPR